MVHCYELNGYYIALDVNSGGVHILDKVSFDLLKTLSAPMAEECPAESISALSSLYSEEALREAYAELYDLYRQDMLFSADTYEKFSGMMTNSPIKAMCLHIAHDCNLRCDYCFASTGDFGGGRKLMPLEVGKAAIDFLLTHSGSRRNLELDFFGGEPLMNMGVVKEIVAYAREREKEFGKNFRFTLTTNGLLLNDDYIDFINKEMSNIVLSIDGRKEVNDQLRRRVDGRGCYDTIVPKYQKLVDRRGHDNYYVRGTFTAKNLDFSEDVLHLNALGFDQISVEPVVSDPNLDYSIKEKDLPAVFAEYDRLAAKIAEMKKAGSGINFFHFMIDLDQGPCAIKRLRGCGCGNEYVAVTPEGDIYPCHQFVGQPEWKMGSVLDDTLNLEMKNTFAAANIYTKEGCRDCFAKFYCSGGCNANNATYEGNILKPHKIGCELERKRVECAIMIQAALAESEE